MATIYKPKRRYKGAKGSRREQRQEIYQSTRWQKLRELKLNTDPLCEECKERGRVEPATEVHHVSSFMNALNPHQRNRLAYDYDNLQSLCRECHQAKHKN